MRHVRLASFVLCLTVRSAAFAADGAVYLYAQPAAGDAARLSLALESIAAVSSDGTVIPLQLRLQTIPAGQPRQRLLATGRLPIGTYAGFQFTAKPATLAAQTGETRLTVTADPVPIDAQFVISARQALVYWLTLAAPGSLAGGAPVSPRVTVAVPPRPIAAQSGFVTNAASNSITIFDKALAQAVGVIETCTGPAGAALDSRRRRLFVACPDDEEVQAIDVATGEITDRSRLSPGDRPRELALTPDGATLLSVNTGSDSVSMFDALSLTRQDRIPVGSGPVAVAVEPAGRRAFVSNLLSGSLTVIDLQARRAITTISTDASPLRAQFNRSGDRLYVVHERSPYLTVLDARQLTTVTRARLRIGISAIAVDTVRDLICIGSENDPAIEFYDPNALMPLYTMRTAAGISFLAFDPEVSRLYMVAPRTRTLAVARVAERRVIAEIDVGDAPYAVVVMGEQ